MMTPFLWAAAAAAIVIAGQSAWIVGLRSDVTEQTEMKNRAIQAGATCSENTRILAEAGDVALAAAEKERDAAALRSRDANRRAQAIINAPRPVPADICASAGADFDLWLMERRK